jgi:hypothetical protein
MNEVIAPDRANGSEVTDLPPAVSAMIDASMARAAGSAAARRPVVPIRHPAEDHSTRMRAYRAPAKRTRIPAPENMTLVGLFLVVFVACWMTALMGFSIARAADRAGMMCTAQSRLAPGTPVLPVKLCDRLPEQG